MSYKDYLYSSDGIILNCCYHSGHFTDDIEEKIWHSDGPFKYFITPDKKYRIYHILTNNKQAFNIGVTSTYIINYSSVQGNIYPTNISTNSTNIFCKEFLVEFDKNSDTHDRTFFEVKNDEIIKLSNCNKIIFGPEGTINKYITYKENCNDPNDQVKPEWDIRYVSLYVGKDGGIFDSLPGALQHCNSLLYLKIGQLKDKIFQNNLKMS
jgi:hypothetical protein